MNLPSYEMRKDLNKSLDIYMKDNRVKEFDSNFLDILKNTNVPMLRDFYQIFEEGLNIGTCGLTARYLSYLFEEFTLVENGVCDMLKGTKGAKNGEHAWLVVGDYVYDTTLMLVIEKELAYNELGYTSYKEVSSEQLLKDDLYIIQKEISKDQEDLKWKRKLISNLNKSKFKCSLLGVE